MATKTNKSDTAVDIPSQKDNEASVEKIYECWDTEDGPLFATQENVQEFFKHGHLDEKSVKLYSFRARNWNEAMTLHYLKQGFGEYRPMNDEDQT